ncbi:MAG: energy-coupling factor transporter transmembrane component T [Eubacterium sp.]|nr:energy-coupling factor transporter transmembrane component T [Eubacterium sp.]
MNRSRGKETQVHPALRMAAAFLFVILSAVSVNAIFTIAVLAGALLMTAMKKAREIPELLKAPAAASLLSLLITLPAVFLGSPATMLTVTMKVFTSVLILALLNNHLRWQEMTAAFGTLGMPQIFVFTLDMTMRFLVILGRYSNEILEAVSLRRIGKKTWKNAGTGGVLGSTYLHAVRAAEGTSEAQTCRCFRGEYKNYRKYRFGIRDAGMIALMALVTAFFIYTCVLAAKAS